MNGRTNGGENSRNQLRLFSGDFLIPKLRYSENINVNSLKI